MLYPAELREHLLHLACLLFRDQCRCQKLYLDTIDSDRVLCTASKMNNSAGLHSSPDATAPFRTRRFRLKETIWLMTLLVCAAIVYFSPLKGILTQAREVHEFLEAQGSKAILAFVVGASVITAMGFPRMLIYPVGGLAFGFFWGLTWSVVALLFGGYIPFCYARWGGRGWILRRWPKMGRVADYFHERSYRTVILMRILPMPGFLTNSLLGITRIKHRSYLLGTLLGSIPPGIPAALLGGSVVEENPTTQFVYVFGSVILFVILWFVIPFCLRKHPSLAQFKTALQEEPSGMEE